MKLTQRVHRPLLVVLMAASAGIGILPGRADAGAVAFQCSGGFVTATGNSALEVGDSNWWLRVTEVIASPSDSPVPFVPLASNPRYGYTIGEIPAGTTSIRVHHVRERRAADGVAVLEYWGAAPATPATGDPFHDYAVAPGCTGEGVVVTTVPVTTVPSSTPTTSPVSTAPTTSPDTTIPGTTIPGTTPVTPAPSTTSAPPTATTEAGVSAGGEDLPTTGSDLQMIGWTLFAGCFTMLGASFLISSYRRRAALPSR